MTNRVKDERNFFSSMNNNIVMIDQYQTPKIKQKVKLLPRNVAQEKYIDALENHNTNIVFAVGPAGSGKSLCATVAGIDQLKRGIVDKIIITRPAVSVDEQHGFLPGSLFEKMQPWVLPILDYFYQYYTKKDVQYLIEDGILEIAPLAYMRGRTFNNAWIIGDEFQNSTISQMKMLLTRIGANSKIVVTGDLDQHDRGYSENGLKDIMDKLANHPNDKIFSIKFSNSDVERHPIIADILNIYDKS